MAIKKENFPVLQMSCASCAMSVESILKSSKGILNAAVNFGNNSAMVEWDNNITNETDIRNTVRSIGYDLVIDLNKSDDIVEESQELELNKLKNRTLWSAIFTLPVFIIGMFFMNMPYGNWISLFLSAPVVFYFGNVFFISTWKKLKHRSFNMDTLVALSTGIAFAFSTFNTIYPQFWTNKGIHPHVYFETAAMIIVFISSGKLLEEKVKSSTSGAIKKLMGLQPKTVKIVFNSSEKEIPISELKINDIVIVRPGEKIAVDGIITEGSSFIDESMINGEPIAVEKTIDDKVFSGTVNQKGSFKFRAEKVGSDTLLAQIIKTVKQAQGSKAPVQKLADQIAGIFVPIVISISIITFICWIIFGGDDAFSHALLNSISVLVIACPCALGLATPTAIIVGVGKGAINNILIKDAGSLETAYKVNAVVLDKTGTITEGKPQVTEVYWSEQISAELKSVLFTIESRSEHPLAEAVVSYLKNENVSIIGISDIVSITGKGISAKHKDEQYFIGNKRLIDENNIKINSDASQKANDFHSAAKTVLYFSNSDSVIALIAVADKIKSTSKNAVERLLQNGIEVYMLTGDNEQTAAAVAKETGIKNYKSEVLPGDKASFIKGLQKNGKIVAMVGDGINDSEALASADISVAMGKGSDIAMDVAKITLITSDLSYLPKSFLLSKRIVMGIRQNLFWAFIYNIIGIPLAAGVLYPINGFLLNPMIAGAAMALSSVSVVANSLRLKTIQL